MAAGNTDFLVNRAVVVTLGKVNWFIHLDAVLVFNMDFVAVGTDDFTGTFSQDQLAGVLSDFTFDTGTNDW